MTTEDNQKISADFLEKILKVLMDIFLLFRDQTEKSIQFDTQGNLLGQDMSKKRWKNANNSIPSEGEANSMPSMTIPQQALSIPEIMKRYARGLPLEGKRVPEFDEDPENPMPDLSRMDIIDKHATIEQAKEEMRDIAFKYRKEQDEKKQKAYEEYKQKFEELDKKYKNDLKSQSSLNPDQK